MRAKRTALLCLLVALTAGSADGAFAQKNSGRGPSPDVGRRSAALVGWCRTRSCNSVSVLQVEALQRRFGLARLESQTFQLSNSTLYRWRILDRRSVTASCTHSKATGS